MIVAVLVLPAGCATAPRAASAPQRDRTERGFPTQKALDALTSTPLPQFTRETSAAEVVEYEAVTAPAQSWVSAPHSGEAPWDALLARETAGLRERVASSTAMNCVAREVARFIHGHRVAAAPSLESWLAARCRATVQRLSTSWLSGEVDDRTSEAELFAQWEPKLGEQLARMLEGSGAGIDVGLAMYRDGGRAVVAIVRGERHVELTRVSPETGPIAELVIEGRLLVPAATMGAMINHGRFGVSACLVEGKLPEFRVTCAPRSEDESAWVELAIFPPNRILGRSAGALLVSPANIPIDRYFVSSYGTAVASSAADITRELAAAINRVRGEAGLAPVREAEAQRATAERVAPYYFGSAIGALPPDVGETVALGMRAGWEVDGLIRYGHFVSASSVGTTKLEHLLRSTLDRPYGRQAVLDPRASQLSIGAVFAAEPKMMGVIISTYAFFDEEAPSALEARALARINKLRAEAGQAPLKNEGLVAPVRDEVAKDLINLRATPESSLHRYLAAAGAEWRSGVSGWVMTGSELDALPIPKELLETQSSRVSLMVALHRGADEPWASLVVIVVQRSANVTTASHDAASPALAHK